MTRFFVCLFLGFLIGYALRNYVAGEIPRLERKEFCESAARKKAQQDFSTFIREARRFCAKE